MSGAGFTVASRSFAAGAATTSPVTVTTTGATTYTVEQKATASALKVGVCMTARGPEDSSGTVAATSIAVRPPTAGSCTTGAGRGPGA